jgi:hypothetical protein
LTAPSGHRRHLTDRASRRADAITDYLHDLRVQAGWTGPRLAGLQPAAPRSDRPVRRFSRPQPDGALRAG